MATYGIGIDIVDISRVRKILEGDSDGAFRKRIFGEPEIAYCEKFSNKAEHYAARFAAKEAFIKACHRRETAFKDIVVHNGDTGEPRIVLEGAALKIFEKFKIHVSLTHASETASAIVLIEE